MYNLTNTKERTLGTRLEKEQILVIDISMATHNQMTLILWNLKFTLFIHFPNILSLALAAVEAHIIILQRRLYR